MPVVAPIVIGAGICWRIASCRTTVIRWAGAAAAGILGTREGIRQANESAESGNSNPYNGPVDEPVVVVDGDGNAIPVGEGEQISSSPNGKYQQVKDQDGQPTGTRMDKGGHRGHADPKAQGPHAHRPGVTDETGNPHLPINPPRPREDERPEIPDPPEKPQL